MAHHFNRINHRFSDNRQHQPLVQRNRLVHLDSVHHNLKHIYSARPAHRLQQIQVLVDSVRTQLVVDSLGLQQRQLSDNFNSQVPQMSNINYYMEWTLDTLMKSGQSTSVNTKQHCITAMKEYERKSLEDIRFEDYAANRKGPQAGSIPGSSGAATPTDGGFLFGASASQPSTPTANNPLGGCAGKPQNSVFSQARPAQSTELFGKSFATTATSTAFGDFGTAAAATANLFGAKPTCDWFRWTAC